MTTLCSRLRSPALIRWAALLWCLGVELGPNLHIGLHARLAPHVHGHAAGHDHTHHHHAHHEHVAARHPDQEHVEAPHAGNEPAHHARMRAVDPDHGRHDPLHRGIAVMLVAAPDPVAACVAYELLAATSWVTTPICDRAPREVRVRGPPDRDVASRPRPARTT